MPSRLSEPYQLIPDSAFLDSHPQLTSLARQLSMKYAHRELVTDQDLKAVGSSLWGAIDPGTGFDEALAASRAAQQTLALVVDSQDPAVQALPWECLYHPSHGFVGREPGFTMLRQIDARAPMPASKGPLRVLLFTTLPDDLDPETERLDVEEEQAQVLEALTPLVEAGLAELKVLDDGQLETLDEELKKTDYHLVFLCGHGRFHSDMAGAAPPRAIFLFEGPDGRGKPVAAKDLAHVFQGRTVQAVVLVACESGQAASDDLNTGLSLAVLGTGVPHVIGMRESVLDVAGTRFARTLCDALARREPLGIALQAARAEIVKPLSGVRLDTNRQDDGSAELSLGQWCLPLLYTRAPDQALVDWDFEPEPPAKRPLVSYRTIADIHLPARFIGRRLALRELGRRIREGQTRRLLITGPGGQGKTSLAGRLIERLQDQGFVVCAYNARRDNPWEMFKTSLQFALPTEIWKQLDPVLGRLDTEAERARLLLDTLMGLTRQKLLLFLDNLEDQQAPETGALRDPDLAVWLETCQAMGEVSPLVIATSRWALPDWQGNHDYHHKLRRAPYGDFLRYHQELAGRRQHATQDRDRLRRLYETLGGNFKGLELFGVLGALEVDEEAFLEKLEQTQSELQLYMAVAEVVGYLSEAQRRLLSRMRAYATPVISDGVIALGLDLADPAGDLERLVALSLLDVEFDPDLALPRYQLSAPVGEWLNREEPPLEPAQKATAARFQVHAFQTLATTITQALAAHEALKRAGQAESAARFGLDYIVSHFDRRGLYRALLDDFLPEMRAVEVPQIRGKAFNMSGKVCLSTGDYDTALEYLKQSLEIRRAIGDRAGEGTTLNNISQIYDARGDYDTALEYLKQSLEIRRAIGDRAGEGTTLNNISQIYKARGDYDTALEYLKQSLEIRRAIGDRAGEGTTLNNISQIYDARGDYDTALEYLKQSLEIQRAIGDRAGEGTTLNNISQIYDARGDYDTALEYLKQSLEIYRAIGDRAGEGTTLNNISQIYKARGDYDTALEYLKQSLEIQREIGDLSGLCATLFNMGHIHMQNDEQAEAMGAWLSVYSVAKRIGNAEALQALEGLGKQLGLGGLEGWEQLAANANKPGK